MSATNKQSIVAFHVFCKISPTHDAWLLSIKIHLTSRLSKFSFGVSVKMNILLFAPGLLLVFLQHTGLFETIGHLAECAIVQVSCYFLTWTCINYCFLSAAFRWCLSISKYRRLSGQCVWVQPAVPLQMDCKLANAARGHLPGSAFPRSSSWLPSICPRCLPRKVYQVSTPDDLYPHYAYLGLLSQIILAKPFECWNFA